ncbi:MAG: hypothetical protein V3U00_02595, partial [Gammaproteobacteria bacterium]
SSCDFVIVIVLLRSLHHINVPPAVGNAPRCIEPGCQLPRKCSGATLSLMRSSHSPGICSQ